jgi:hypothetical protein
MQKILTETKKGMAKAWFDDWLETERSQRREKSITDYGCIVTTVTVCEAVGTDYLLGNQGDCVGSVKRVCSSCSDECLQQIGFCLLSEL